jgi:hypothetical protein
MLSALQARIVFQRLRKARADRIAAADHGTGPHAHFHTRRAAFWQAAADAAAAGDLSPVSYADDFAPGETTQAEGVRVILVVVR